MTKAEQAVINIARDLYENASDHCAHYGIPLSPSMAKLREALLALDKEMK